MISAVFRKAMENVRKHGDIRCETNCCQNQILIQLNFVLKMH